MYNCYNIALFGPKSGKTQDRKSQKSRENRKDKRSRENRRDKKGGRDHCKNRINPVMKKSNGFEVNHYIIYQCYQKLMVLR